MIGQIFAGLFFCAAVQAQEAAPTATPPVVAPPSAQTQVSPPAPKPTHGIVKNPAKKTEAAPAVASPKSHEAIAIDAGPEGDASANGGFRKPVGPLQGGVVEVPHPNAAKGLLRINKDGSYQYKTELHEKSQAVSVLIGAMSPPDISGNAGITYKSMYGAGNLYGLNVDYEWDPFKSFGTLGVQLGVGFASGHGNGRLATGENARESYNLYLVPLSAFAIYRFEYVRRQWIVPFVNGGFTYYGMAEKRDDDQPMKFAGAEGVGGGGGLHFSISRIDPAGAFTLDREYGVADMWFTVEARVTKGLDADVDFTGETISAGITVDF